MDIIEVYEDEDGYEGEHFADILVDEEGNLDVRIIAPGDNADKLQEVLSEIRSKEKLTTRTEEFTEIDGETVRLHKMLEVTPGEPAYIWAVNDYIQENCDIFCEVSEDEESE